MEYKRYNKYVYGLQGLRGKPKSFACYIFLFLFIAGTCSIFLYVREMKSFFSFLEQVPVVREYSVITLPTTAYSKYETCPDRECITASGTVANKETVASNCLPFGTTLEVNNNIYTVEDRHAKWLSCRADMFFGNDYDDYINAKRYGVVNKLIKIL